MALHTFCSLHCCPWSASSHSQAPRGVQRDHDGQNIDNPSAPASSATTVVAAEVPPTLSIADLDSCVLLYSSSVPGLPKSAKGVGITLGTSQAILLEKRSSEIVHIPKLHRLVAWCRGTWSPKPGSAEQPDSLDVLFQLELAKDMTVQAAVAERLATKPNDAAICYHNRIERPITGNVANITLELRKQVAAWV